MTAAAAGAMSVPAATGEIPAGMTPIRRLPCQSIMLREAGGSGQETEE